MPANLEDLLDKISELAPDGYMIGFHVRYSRPMYRSITYPSAWIEEYASKNFVAADPVVIWSLQNDGWSRWSAMSKDIQDPLNVMDSAAAFGLKYGAVMACGGSESRTIAGFAKRNNEFTDVEISKIYGLLTKAHDHLGRKHHVGPRQIEALEGLAAGMTYEQLCCHIGISRTALRFRLSGARLALGAESNAEAVRMAIDAGVISSNTYGGFATGLPTSSEYQSRFCNCAAE